MHRLTLLCVGRIRVSWIAEGCREYLDRLKPDFRIDVRELAESREKDPERQKKDESSLLFSAMHKHEGASIILDETGDRMTSRDFASFIASSLNAGEPLAFVIGGSYGLTEEVKKAATKRLRLSDMTLTHELARLVLLEQLYRAMQIRKGTGYHH
jgi:23S rRNA (pseudouridine1915-N3)-methyltransferase